MDFKEAVRLGHRLEKRGRNQNAFRAFRSALEQYPDVFPLLMGAGRTACAIGKTAAGLKFFRRALKVRPDSAAPIIQIGKEQLKTDAVEAAKTFSDGVARFPNNDRLRQLDVQSRIRLSGDKDLHFAFDIDAELERSDHNERTFLQVIRKNQAKLTLEEQTHYYERLTRKFENSESQLPYVSNLISRKRYREALEAIKSISNPAAANHPRILVRRAICKGALGEIAEAKTLLEKCGGPTFSTIVALNTCASFLDVTPDLEMATKVLQDVNKSWRLACVDRLIEFSENIPPPQRALLDGDIIDRDVRFSAPGGAPAAVLVFAGYARKTGALPFSLIDRFFAGHGIAVASLTDPKGCLFMNGVPALGDRFDSTIAALRNKLEIMGVESIYTLGNSGGGTAAMAYGCALGARRAISFSGPTDTRRSFLAEIGDKRAQAVIYALNKRLDESQLNTRAWLEQRKERCPIHAYYCENEPHDTLHANNIAHLPEVTLKPIDEFSVHDSIGGALGTGDLLQAFNSVLVDMSRLPKLRP